jgi:hypothetical protein
MKKYWFHPLVFALYPVISLFVENSDKVILRDLLSSIGFAALLMLLSWTTIYFFIRNRPKAAITVSIFLAFFYSYGYAFLLINIYSLGHPDRQWAKFLAYDRAGTMSLLIIWSGLFFLIIALLMKSKKNIAWVTKFMNVVAATIIIFLGVNLVLRFSQEGRTVAAYVNTWDKSLVERLANNRQKDTYKPLPDIYYIILDGYGRNDTLNRLYDYDNSAFLDSLSKKGFYVANQSTANYSYTIYSLASSLNSIYLNQMPSQLGEQTKNLMPLREMYANNFLFNFLHDKGYFTRSIPTGFLLTDNVKADRIDVPYWSINAFQNQLLSATPIPEIFGLLHLKDQFELHRQRINYALDEIANRPNVEQPVFTFVHILAPHPPFVFDAAGGSTVNQGIFIIKDGDQYFGSKDDYLEGYRDQLQFISLRIGQIVREVLDHSKRPVIIILQGDHGPGSGLNQGNWEKSDIPERLSILNAYYFPNQDYRQLYPQISPVNSFRVIMNQYFGTSFDLLEDRSYFVSLYDPYTFVDVTNLLH